MFLQVAVNSGSIGSHVCTDVCTFVAGARVEREMIHTFTGRRGLERGRKRASWFPHSLVLPGSSLFLHFCP